MARAIRAERMPVNECWCQEPVNTDSLFWVPNGKLKYKSSASSYHVFLSTSFSCACMFLLQIWIQPEHPKQLTPIFRNLTTVFLFGIFSECDLSWTLFILEAAPALQNIAVSVT